MKLEFSGRVVKGDGIAGRDFDTPTANLDIQPAHLETGIYVAYAEYKGVQYPSVVCYGVGDPPKFEVHLLDFEKEILGEELKVRIFEKVGELVPWSSKERMRQKILHDIELARQILDRRGEESAA